MWCSCTVAWLLLNFIILPVTRATVTVPVWRTSPRRNWRPWVRACLPGSSVPAACSPPDRLMLPQPISPSTWAGERHSGRTLWALAAASSWQRSWICGRTRLPWVWVLILSPPAAGPTYDASLGARTRGGKAVKISYSGPIMGLWEPSPARLGWDREGAAWEEGVSNQGGTQTILDGAHVESRAK